MICIKYIVTTVLIELFDLKSTHFIYLHLLLASDWNVGFTFMKAKLLLNRSNISPQA